MTLDIVNHTNTSKDKLQQFFTNIAAEHPKPPTQPTAESQALKTHVTTLEIQLAAMQAQFKSLTTQAYQQRPPPAPPPKYSYVQQNPPFVPPGHPPPYAPTPYALATFVTAMPPSLYNTNPAAQRPFQQVQGHHPLQLVYWTNSISMSATDGDEFKGDNMHSLVHRQLKENLVFYVPMKENEKERNGNVSLII